MKRQEEPTLEADDTDTKPAAAEPTGLEPVPDDAEALRRERDELKDQLLRRRADFENYRKRVERDKEQATVDARAQILTGLIPTIDNFERALAAPAADPDTVRAGVELIYRNLMSFLESQGVAVQDPAGEAFDPQIHQALSHEPAPGVADGTIVDVFSKGYFLKDRLLRPAMVKVAKGEDGSGSEDTTH